MVAKKYKNFTCPTNNLLYTPVVLHDVYTAWMLYMDMCKLLKICVLHEYMYYGFQYSVVIYPK